MVYGVTAEDYQRMLAGQRGVCKIRKLKYAKRLCIDHDHQSGDVRGGGEVCGRLLRLLASRRSVPYRWRSKPV